MTISEVMVAGAVVTVFPDASVVIIEMTEEALEVTVPEVMVLLEVPSTTAVEVDPATVTILVD